MEKSHLEGFAPEVQRRRTEPTVGDAWFSLFLETPSALVLVNSEAVMVVVVVFFGGEGEGFAV